MQHLNFSSINNIGQRKSNEDKILHKRITNEVELFIVCDGVGGNAYGEKAAELVCQLAYRFCKKHIPTIYNKTYFNELFKFLQKEIIIFKNNHPKHKTMATTLALVIIENNNIHTAWAGDSRVYIFEDKKIQFKTKDHTLLQTLIDTNTLDKDTPIEKHPFGNIITNGVSGNTEKEHLAYQKTALKNTTKSIFICSDGVTESVNDNELGELLSLNYSLQEATTFLTTLCENQSRDNYSFYIVQFKNPQSKHN